MARITMLRDNASGCFQFQSHGKVPTLLLCSMYDNDKSLSDVSLTGAAPTGGACNLQPIRAHKNILAHASPHLYDLFTVQGYVDSNKPAYTLTTTDHDSLRSIVKFVYTDKLEVEEAGAVERVRGILKGAKYLLMKDLVDACETFLASSDQIDVENCINVFQFAFKYKCANLLSVVCAFIAKNLLAVSLSTKFLGLTQDECAKFLLSDPVATANADDRCRAAIAWLNHESPSRAGSAECIMSMAALDAAGLTPETLLLAAQSAVIRPTIKGFALTLIDAMASNMQRVTSQLESERHQSNKKQKLEKARGEAWYVVGSAVDGKAFYRFDVARREWSTLPELPWERKFAGACAIGNKLIIMGGLKRGTQVASIDEYDTVTQAWSANKARLNCVRSGLAGAADSSYAYAFGGWDRDGKVYDVAERYSIGSRKLESLADMDNKRYAAAAVCKNNNTVFVVGGLSKFEDGEKFSRGTIDKYEHTSKQWVEIATLKESRCGLGAAFLGDDFYIAGGCLSTTVEILNTHSGQVRLDAKLNQVRRGCKAVPLDHNVLCVLGGEVYDASVVHSSVETFDKREGKWSTGNIVPDMPRKCADFGFAHVRP